MNRWEFGNNSLLIAGTVNITDRDTVFGVVALLERHPSDNGVPVSPRNRAVASTMVEKARVTGMESVKLGFHSSGDVDAFIKSLRKFFKGMKAAEAKLEEAKLSDPSLVVWREQVKTDEAVKKGKE